MTEKPYEPTLEDLETLADVVTGHGISGLKPEHWPILVAALEDYIEIRRGVENWDERVERAVAAVSANQSTADPAKAPLHAETK